MLASIITCVHNQTIEYFAECATSVKALGDAAEWIVVDDGSRPDVSRQLEAIANSLRDFLTVSFLVLSQNSGLSAARNFGMAGAKGEWIVILDSDDRLRPTVLSCLNSLPARSSLVAFDCYYFGDTNAEFRSIQPFADLFELHGLTTLDPFLWWDFYYHGLVAKRSLVRRIGGYHDRLRVGEDQDVLLRAVAACAREEITFVPQVAYEYRKNALGVCFTMTEEVFENYCKTMLTAARNLGAPFIGCRFAGEETVLGASIDRYEYQIVDGAWVSWREWRERVS